MVWRYVQVGLAVLGLALAAGILVAWRAARQEQAQLQLELKLTQQELSQANERQKTRETALNEQLANLTKQRKAVNKPEDIVKALPDVLPLPVPLTLVQEPFSKAEGQARPAGKSSLLISTPEPKVELPVEDLKPLYDFALDCKACQARLAASLADLKDEQAKTVALGRERDSALQAARGGSVARRIFRAAKWFAIGAAAGAVAVKLAR